MQSPSQGRTSCPWPWVIGRCPRRWVIGRCGAPCYISAPWSQREGRRSSWEPSTLSWARPLTGVFFQHCSPSTNKDRQCTVGLISRLISANANSVCLVTSLSCNSRHFASMLFIAYPVFQLHNDFLMRFCG